MQPLCDLAAVAGFTGVKAYFCRATYWCIVPPAVLCPLGAMTESSLASTQVAVTRPVTGMPAEIWPAKEPPEIGKP